MSLNFIDIFCGIGGFHIALKNLGHKCVFASDIDKKWLEEKLNKWIINRNES